MIVVGIMEFSIYSMVVVVSDKGVSIYSMIGMFSILIGMLFSVIVHAVAPGAQYYNTIQ